MLCMYIYFQKRNKFEDTHRKRAQTLKSHLNAQHSNGSLRFVLFYDVYLQTYFDGDNNNVSMMPTSSC